MKKRTKEENAAYSKMLRARKKVAPAVAPEKERSTVAPIIVAPAVQRSTPIVAPIPTDKDTVISILRGRVALLEKQVSELKKMIPKKEDSPYRGF